MLRLNETGKMKHLGFITHLQHVHLSCIRFMTICHIYIRGNDTSYDITVKIDIELTPM